MDDFTQTDSVTSFQGRRFHPARLPLFTAHGIYTYRKQTTTMKGLIRIRPSKIPGSHSTGHGWQARCYASGKSRYFGSIQYGGIREARSVASLWLTNQRKASGDSLTHRRVRRKPTTTGDPPGVYSAPCFGRPGYMVAWATSDGQLYRRWFSFSKYGANTLNEACKWRAEVDRQCYGSKLLPATRYALSRKRLIREVC